MATERRRAGFVEGPKFSADDFLLLSEVGITVGSMISPKLSADDIGSYNFLLFLVAEIKCLSLTCITRSGSVRFP